MKRRSIQGVTLIELMIGIVLSLVVSFAVNSVLDLSVMSKRRTQASGDMNQVMGYTQVLLDRLVRSAGSGFSQETVSWGCPIQAAKSGAQILPAQAALPAPFASVTTGTAGVFRLAPVLVAAGQSTPSVSGQPSDVLIVMSGQSSTPMFATSNITATALTLSSGVGLRANDVLLMADTQPIAGPTVAVAKPCLVTQVSSTYAASNDGNVALSGSYYGATINGNALTGLSSNDTTTFNLGNTGGNTPLFQLIGVGANNTLYSYDLLQFDSNTPVPLADGIFELKALYGVAKPGERSIDSWKSPTGEYALANLMLGTEDAAKNINNIKALRIGLILRNGRVGKASAPPSSLTLFSSLGAGLTYTRTLTTSEQNFRYQTVEFTVPVVNSILQ